MAISHLPTATISERLEREAVQIIECTVPAEMTLDEWRRRRPHVRHRRRQRPLRARTPDAARHLALVPDEPSDPPPLAA
jgi:hypothetical protein